MNRYTDVYDAIHAGKINLPPEISRLPMTKLQEIVVPLVDFISEQYAIINRVPRQEVMKFGKLLVDDEEYVGFLVNLSRSGVLFYTNRKSQKFYTTGRIQVSLDS